MLEPSGVVLPPLFKNGTMALASQVRDIVQVRIIRDKSRQSDPTLSRREGFNDYIFSHFPECELTSILIIAGIANFAISPPIGATPSGFCPSEFASCVP